LQPLEFSHAKRGRRSTRLKLTDESLGCPDIDDACGRQSGLLLELDYRLVGALAEDFTKNLRRGDGIPKGHELSLQQGHIFAPLVQRQIWI
jgi:hypothetical protein